MEAAKRIKDMLRPGPTAPADKIAHQPAADITAGDVEKNQDAVGTSSSELDDEAGVANIKAAQSVWGRTGYLWVWFGMGMIMTLFELDNATVYTYSNYSTSEFNSLSALGTLSTATVIIFAVAKPPIAKISNVIGRGQTLALTVAFYIIAETLMANANGIASYACGQVFYNIGQSGMNVMTHIIIADITSLRWRGLGLAVPYFPFLITPFISANIVGSVVAPNGIGWRWGIGMFAILMPFGASFLIATLLWYQRKARKQGLLLTKNVTLYSFCSEVDLGGMLLFIVGFGCFLVPLTVAANESDGWKTPWVIALIIIGALLLIALPFYEKHYARYPVLPMWYLKNMTILMSCLLVATDSIGFSATHTYLYAWGTVAHNLDATVATYYVYINGVVQTFSGILAGLFMYYTRRYKWLTMAGVVLRLVGYIVMLRLRGANQSLGELFGQQVLQGFGSGIIQTAPLVAPQLVIPDNQVAQMIAVVWTFAYLGSSLGSTIAGGIYTNTMRERLHAWLGPTANATLVDELYNSITGPLPEWGTAERDAIDYAYSDVIRYITYAAIGVSIPPIVMAWYTPNLKIPDDVNPIKGDVAVVTGENSPMEQKGVEGKGSG